jgi:hypothetical protein
MENDNLELEAAWRRAEAEWDTAVAAAEDAEDLPAFMVGEGEARRAQQRVEAAAAAARAARERFEAAAMPHVMALAPAHGSRINSMHVHRNSAKYLKFIPGIVSIIQEEIGVKDYSDIISHIDSTIGNFIRTDEEYIKEKFNSKIQTREQWIADYTSVRNRLQSHIQGTSKEKKDMMGAIIDIVFKYNMQSCFCPGYIYDTAHAYEGNAGHEQVSCWGGSVERVLTTFINCSKGLKQPIFLEINNLIGEVTSWEDLSKPTQTMYLNKWDFFIQKWAQDNIENKEILAMPLEQRNEALMEAFKAKELAENSSRRPVPDFVVEYIKQNKFPTKRYWQDVGYNSNAEENANAAAAAAVAAARGKEMREAMEKQRQKAMASMSNSERAEYMRSQGNGGNNESGRGGAEGGRRRTRHKRKTRKSVRKHKKSLKRR